MWDLHDILRTARQGLEEYSRATVIEQAVHGLDHLTEVRTHPILAAAFLAAGLGVIREHPYPGIAAKRPKFAERQRCDLVLLPRSGQVLLDPVAELLQQDKAAGTLFESFATQPTVALDTLRSEEALWLEVKVVGQYCYTQGVPGPNRAYGSELTGSLYTDLAKINADEALRWSALLLILYTDTSQTGSHDLTIALHRALDKGHKFRSPITETFPIPDRIGNSTCTVALLPR
ncbi:MAG TPA: hypothetical protein VD997_01155 [Phycisphaerales bacterium]|nr:hypothetical protein [Phycisphaerales bacterium]